MSVRPFEQFLVQSLIEWIGGQLEAGARYQFKSPSAENGQALFDALLGHSAGSLVIDGVTLPMLNCNGVALIPVLHGEGEGFSENYISHLRDLVAGRGGAFNNAALLIIHNSMLDTLNNSAFDLGGKGAIWHPEQISKKLYELIDIGHPRRDLSACLLEEQLKLIKADGSTVFGFASLFSALDKDVDLNFDELHLFNDPLLLSCSGNREHISQRLQKNRELRRDIEDAVEHYDREQLENILKEFSPHFVREHFYDDRWRQLSLESLLQEITANKAQKLLLDEVTLKEGVVHQRAKAQTKAGLRELSLMLVMPKGATQCSLFLNFLGNDLEAQQLQLKHNRALSKLVNITVSRAGGKRCKANLVVPVTGEPTFFSIELKRDNQAEEYKFRCLLLEEGDFYLDEILHHYRVEPGNGKTWLTLQLEENRLRVNAQQDSCRILEEDQVEVDCRAVGWADFERLAESNEQTIFTLRNGDRQLTINVEGPAADDGITLPLLFDKTRFSRLFNDERNAEYNRANGRIVFDNAESGVVGIRQQLLKLEARMVDEQLLYLSDDDTLTSAELNDFSPALSAAYTTLFTYLNQKKSLPSLVAWGQHYCALVQGVVEAYEEALASIVPSSVLTQEQKRLMRVGLYRHEGILKLTPLHPLVLAYYLALVSAILSEPESEEGHSFAELPDVTRERLVASGLLPFVYDNDSGYAHLQVVRENCFWFNVVPQKQESFDYIKRLVRDKLAEFTQAYARLFSAGAKSSLIINAINQGGSGELFLGLVEHFKQHKEQSIAIHVNCYDERLQFNDFDRFAETQAYEELKVWLGLNSGKQRADADMLIDLIRSRLTYSKFTLPKGEESFAYSHLAFFRNKEPVECRDIKSEMAMSGVLCDGLIAGEAAEIQNGAYFTSFGLRGVDYLPHQTLRLAHRIANLWKPAHQSNTPYLETSLGLAVSADFQSLLQRSYKSSLWTTIIDPKVTLDFFANQQDVVLIHYSDQYTSAAGYDAITVTQQVELFQRLLQKEGHGQGEVLLTEFNAFNGEWLLKMLTANPKERKEKNGIIGAYKFASALLRQSDICWVPLSVAEMIRVSGNVGLKMSDSEFSRQVQGYRKGAISDDVLFVGFKEDRLYLMPLEVKTGVRPDYAYAGQQAVELKRYLSEEVLGQDTFASRLYRGLFIRQVLMQVDKLCLYGVLERAQLQPLLDRREWWMRGDYQLGALPDYVEAMVVAHVENDSCFKPSYQTTGQNVLQIELPYSLLPALIASKMDTSIQRLVEQCQVPRQFCLMPQCEGEVAQPPVKVSGIEPVIAAQDEAPVATPAPSTETAPQSQGREPLKVLFGHDAFYKSPLYWEPTNTARFMNTNTGIIGTMGTGKTQFTKSLITQLMRQQDNNVEGARIGLLIFDYKSDYVDDAFSEANQSRKLKLHRLPYNPLSLYGDMPMLPVHTATGFSETLAKAFGLGPKQQLRLRKLILDAYELAGISKSDASTWSKPAPTLAQVWDLYMEQEKIDEDSLYAALDSLVTYEIFETQPDGVSSLYELLEGVTVIELAGYSPQIQSLVVALTLDLFYSQMQKRGKPKVAGDYRQITKMILVDEADNFMSQDFPSLRKILKEGREYGVGVILSTQDLSHFKTGENNYGSYILTWVVHRVAEIKNADIKAIFNKDDKADQEELMEQIRKLDKHFSLYIDGEKKMSMMRDRAFWELIP
ncbi:DNA phosphorothioation-dependent restriction protein DptH [Aeromonas hydrophila]|uniref:DNA phosphorothioation-dependent restriction protein DptH n=1 Tax=Aeromonas hydrophila TaxID=644 RepID=UPI00227B895F|nr:DNA phosphorothioation-dependent restriction protein DptH [Aeromonas hydrophila]WAF89724.1 DNA phosphorothioation-dependent restriction protein DptH [Aeromonas hydrophila]WAG02440.1 DNA phosphorothioation-dependent restriction protein DptH [Aeromonas hydrophila]